MLWIVFISRCTKIKLFGYGATRHANLSTRLPQAYQLNLNFLFYNIFVYKMQKFKPQEFPNPFRSLHNHTCPVRAGNVMPFVWGNIIFSVSLIRFKYVIGGREGEGRWRGTEGGAPRWKGGGRGAESRGVRPRGPPGKSPGRSCRGLHEFYGRGCRCTRPVFRQQTLLPVFQSRTSSSAPASVPGDPCPILGRKPSYRSCSLSYTCACT